MIIKINLRIIKIGICNKNLYILIKYGHRLIYNIFNILIWTNEMLINRCCDTKIDQIKFNRALIHKRTI